MKTSLSRKKFFLVEMRSEYLLAWVVILAVYFLTNNAEDDDDEGPGGETMIPAYESQ